MCRLSMFTAVAAVLFALTTVVQAAFVVDPVSATATSSEFGGGPVAVVNGSGISDTTIIETGDPVPVTWPSHNNSGSNMWLTAADSALEFDSTKSSIAITFDLGDSYSLTDIRVWNSNAFFNGDNNSARSIKKMDVLFSTTSATTGFGNTIQFDNMPQAPGTNGYEGFDLSLGQTVSAQWVKFEVYSVHGPINSEYRAGLSEVRFVAIPEPTSLVLLGAGAALMLTRRRR